MNIEQYNAATLYLEKKALKLNENKCKGLVFFLMTSFSVLIFFVIKLFIAF